MKKLFCQNCGSEITHIDEENDLVFCSEENCWTDEYIEPKYQIGDTITYKNEDYIVYNIRTTSLDDNDIPLFMIHYYTNKGVITEFNNELIKVL